MTNTLGYIYCGSRGTSLYLGSTRTAFKTLVILVASPRSFFSNFVLTCMLHLRFAMIPSLVIRVNNEDQTHATTTAK